MRIFRSSARDGKPIVFFMSVVQVLQFEKFKDAAMYCLSNQHTEGLLELLEDAQSSLAMMLTSKHIGPLQHEAAAWAMKLKEVSEVLEQVQ